MLVVKFGGSSVGDSNSFKNVASIVEQAIVRSSDGLLVVLSAMAGVTNLLINGANQALDQNLSESCQTIELIRQKHELAINELFLATACKQELNLILENYLKELFILYQGISYLGELSAKSLDNISKYGELLSSNILYRYLLSLNIKADYLDVREVLITDNSYSKANPLMSEIKNKVFDKVIPKFKNTPVIVTQGFIGATQSGSTTTLGRGGSDYSAAILGLALRVQAIEIWTDVDGMMTCDPRVVPNATVIDEVSFEEASELAYFGAKVLHPLTIRPAVDNNIPVKILNSKNPTHKGTLISNWVNPDLNKALIRAIAFKTGITAIFVSSPKMLMAYGFLAKVFAIFEKYQTSIDLISTSEVSVALTIDDKTYIKQIIEDLSTLADVSVKENLAIVTVVGRYFRNQSGTAGYVFESLKNINILMISGGASDINLSFVVNDNDVKPAVKLIHDKFFAKT